MRSDKSIKSLIEEFDYPRLGPGMMWDAFRERFEERWRMPEAQQPNRANSCTTARAVTGLEVEHEGTALRAARGSCHLDDARPSFDSASRPAGARVRLTDAASSLKYRDFLTVALIIDQAAVFPDNWIYVHDDRVRVGRIQNYKNWSPDMVPDTRWTCLGLEYFCFAGDGLWSKTDAELVELATRELETIGLARAGAGPRRDGGSGAESVPGLRRGLRVGAARNRGSFSSGSAIFSSSDATACTSTTIRITRC